MAIKNYLKDVKEITAPLNWKSSPDSPPTQLAYVTKPEIDLLVKANLHGSMNGKPNKGPKGIISLDGFGVDDEDSVVSQAQQQQFQQNLQQSSPSQQVGTSQSSFDTGAPIPTVFQQQQQMEQQQNQPVPGVSFGITPEEAKQIKEEKEEAESLAAKGKDIAQGIMTTLMGGGEGGNLDLTKEEAYADLPAGMHPLRKQYEYLAKKYGDKWKDTTQAKVLESYLSGVPVERGGSLGARDDTYGGGEFRTETGAIDPELEKRRQDILTKVAAGMYTPNTLASLFQDLEREGIGADLTADQFFNFRQQLMAADPSPENQAYKSALPFSSGAGLGALSRFIPGMGALQTFAGGLFPERDLTGYQQNIDPISVGFQPLPSPDPGSNPSGFFERKTRPPFQVTLPDPSQPKDPRYPLPGDPVRPPFRPPFMPGTGIETVFNPMFLGPSFRGSPYTNRGVSPAFYQALTNFPGMA
jgi:hypothetical protein